MYFENTLTYIFFVRHLSYYIKFHGFINSDWAGSVDDKRISTWICFNMHFSTMSWASRKKTFVSLNTAEAEYITTCDACMEAMWLHKLVSGLFDQVLDWTMIYCDDQSCVKLSKILVFHDRSKNIEIEYYFLHARVHRGEVVLQYIFTDEKITNIVVKPLSKMKILCT
jgi:hypothetical protein